MNVKVFTNILEANDRIAKQNNELFKSEHIFVINLMSAPGAGKTLFLEKTIEKLEGEFKIGVIEGDIQTTRDAERIQKYNIPVVQINTGSACHLDANMIKESLEGFNLGAIDLLFIENVGNLVCPAEFKVGEDYKVMILSVTEGDDKPLKYPLMFSESAVLIINKIDLVKYTNFNLAEAIQNAHKINPNLEIFQISCVTEEGLENWLNWVRKKISKNI